MRRLQSDDGSLEHGVGANLSLCCRASEIVEPRIRSPQLAAFFISNVLWYNAEIPRCPLSRRYQGHSGRQTASPDFMSSTRPRRVPVSVRLEPGHQRSALGSFRGEYRKRKGFAGGFDGVPLPLPIKSIA